MGRFNSLELSGNIPHPSAPEEKTAYHGEAPKNAQYFIDRGEHFFYRGEYNRALEEYSRAVGMDSGATTAWQGQVASLIELGEYHESVLWFNNAVGVVGETPDLLALRALAAARTGDFERACGYSDSSLENGGTPLSFIVRGEIFLYSRRNAEYCFEQANSMPGADWKTAVRIADSCLFAEKKASAAMALKFLTPALARYANRGELYLRLAKVRINLKERRAAEQALEACAMLMPDYQIPKELKEATVRGFWARFFGG